MISFLHPAFTFITIILIFYSFLEVHNNRKYNSIIFIAFLMFLLIGFRGVGADFPVYRTIYYHMGQSIDYPTIIAKAMFGDVHLEFEWIYTLLSKFIYDLDLPFYAFTATIAAISFSIKFIFYKEHSPYPSLALLLYMFPNYFTADGGHMRQGAAMAFVLLSFYFIKHRKLIWFVFTIYIAMGFHKSAFIFLPAYWVVLVPLNSTKIIILILASIIASPFEIYNYITFLDSLKDTDVYGGFSAYNTIETENSGNIKFTDLISLMITYFIITYNKEACKNILYYEYMRNIMVVGICLYFIFRMNAIFSTRLVAHYFTIYIIILPNIIAAIKNTATKSFLHIFIVAFAIFYYFVYAILQARGVGYTWDRYYNILFS